MKKLSIPAVLAPSLAAFAILLPAHASPLGKAECEALDKERKSLAQEGVEAAIEKGPEAIKSSAGAGDLERIKRYLMIEDYLRFRCSGMDLPELVTASTPSDDDGNSERSDAEAAERAAAEAAGNAERKAGEKKPAGEADKADARKRIPLPDRKPRASLGQSGVTGFAATGQLFRFQGD